MTTQVNQPARADAPEASALAAALRHAIAGDVRFDAGARALYATDASNYRQLPIGVVTPKTTDDALAAIEICRQHGAPLLNRGGGASLAGQYCNIAVVLDWSKYLNGILEIDPDRRLARVQPGVTLPAVRAAARETLIIADGFSCREQIAQTTHRRALHLAEVLWLALRFGQSGQGDAQRAAPERALAPLLAEAQAGARARVRAGMAGAALATVGLLAATLALWRRQRGQGG